MTKEIKLKHYEIDPSYKDWIKTKDDNKDIVVGNYISFQNGEKLKIAIKMICTNYLKLKLVND